MGIDEAAVTAGWEAYFEVMVLAEHQNKPLQQRMRHVVLLVMDISNMKKNIFIILFFTFFVTNLYANCSNLYRSLGSPSKVSLLWLDDKNGKQAEWALINKIKGNTFTLCSKVRTIII